MAEVAGGLQLLDQALEGEVLVCVSAEGRFAHAAQELRKGGAAGQVGAEEEGCEEEGGGALDLGAVAAGDGGADADVALAGVAVQEDLEGGEQGHEEGGALAAAEGAQGGDHGCAKGEAQGGAVEGLDGGTRAVGRKLEDGRGSLQPLLPVGELALEALALEPLALPVGEVGVLDGQGWERRVPPVHGGMVEEGLVRGGAPRGLPPRARVLRGPRRAGRSGP